MSDPVSKTSGGWGPDARCAAVTVTFDNLGEAADLERGLWPEGEPLGHHFSVRQTVPRILSVLGKLELRATFFVEGLNTELYPEALSKIVDSGHELGYHGWRHEYWAGLSPSDEARLLERGVRQMDELGVRPRGFRPPGGRLNPSSLKLLEDLEFTHCSPAGRGIGMSGSLVILPFEWPMIDAYYYLPRFGNLREATTGSSKTLTPSRFRGALFSALESVVRDGRHLTLLFHPFLEEEADRFAVMRGVLEELRDLSERGLVWCAPYQDVTSWVNEHPEQFGDAPQLDLTQT